MIHPLLRDVVSLDFETIEIMPDGTTKGSTEAYRENFRVDSCAISWYKDDKIVSRFIQGEDHVRLALEELGDRPILVFNYQFESLVTQCRFPDLKLNWQIDAQRLAQVYDNGGDKNAFEVIVIEPEDADDDQSTIKKHPLAGLSLVKCMKRIMGMEDHKNEAHTWLRDNAGIKKGKEGGHLNLLPYDILERYNIADTENTLILANYILNNFDQIEYDWTIDHKLYMGSARRIAEAKRRGILVDRDALTTYIDVTIKEIAQISADFIQAHQAPIRKVERILRLERIRKLKTLKGRKKYLRRGKWKTECAFNPGSNRQLALLFVDVTGIKPFFFTKKGSPSFKSSHLYTYGEGGRLLEKRRKRGIVLKQCEALYLKSEVTGRWHLDLRAVGTVTGRYSGSGGLNVQALSRRDPGLMTALKADPGYVFISSDASAGEPTIITQFSKDPYYSYFCFDGVGKKPFYQDGVLMIDDIYLGYASVCPIFKDELAKTFATWTHEGRSFADQWLVDAEVCKNAVKNLRKNSKWITLAFGYGLGPKTLYNKAIEAGLKVTPKLCKESFQAYKDLFKGIQRYATSLETHVGKTGWLQNSFGYRFVPTEVRKSFNGRIQSEVSSIFHWYSDLLEIQAPYALYVSTIHDENLYMIPENMVQKFKEDILVVVAHMNNQLQWDVKLRFGAVDGKNLYEAK